MSRTIVVTWVAKAGEELKVAQILLALSPLTRAEPGCLRYDVLRSLEDPKRFLLIESYRDDAALQAHTDSDHFKTHVLNEAASLLESRDRAAYEVLDRPFP